MGGLSACFFLCDMLKYYMKGCDKNKYFAKYQKKTDIFAETEFIVRKIGYIDNLFERDGFGYADVYTDWTIQNRL